jgi:hypothetical protein
MARLLGYKLLLHIAVRQKKKYEILYAHCTQNAMGILRRREKGRKNRLPIGSR